MSRSTVELAIADRVMADEKRNAAMLGHDGIDAPLMAFGAFCGVMLIAVEPERDWVWPRGSGPREI